MPAASSELLLKTDRLSNEFEPGAHLCTKLAERTLNARVRPPARMRRKSRYSPPAATCATGSALKVKPTSHVRISLAARMYLGCSSWTPVRRAGASRHRSARLLFGDATFHAASLRSADHLALLLLTSTPGHLCVSFSASEFRWSPGYSGGGGGGGGAT